MGEQGVEKKPKLLELISEILCSESKKDQNRLKSIYENNLVQNNRAQFVKLTIGK